MRPNTGGPRPRPVRNPNSTMPDARPVAATPASIMTASMPTAFHELDPNAMTIAAGLLMAIASAALNLAIDLDPTPAAVVNLMNRTLYRTGGPRAFMTMFYGVLDPADGALEYVSVGHPFPMLRRAGGEVHELGTGSLPLGVRGSIAPRAGATRLEPGDLLVMYTDGIPETVDEAGSSFSAGTIPGISVNRSSPASSCGKPAPQSPRPHQWLVLKRP